jgi:hypothetical protein
MPITQAKTAVVNLDKDTTINGITVGRGNNSIYTNTASGANALFSNVDGNNNTASGANALSYNTTGSGNTASGESALSSNTTGYNNTASGANALFSNVDGNNNTASGASALYYNTDGSYNTASGESALSSNTTGYNNTASGASALYYNTDGSYNTASGANALYYNTTGYNNTASGANALSYNTTGYNNTASGLNALSYNTGFSNTGGFGYDAQVTASNQIQIGNSETTTYAYGAVQDRSDRRDKTEIQDTELGLDFVKSLRPVDFKWDMREDYRQEAPVPVMKPVALKYDATEEEKTKYDQDLSAYNSYVAAKDKWLEDVKLANITHDGSKSRNRFHHGLIAQEVRDLLQSKGIDFGGFQDHKVNGGDDVLSIGYVELIAPLIKAVQELSAEIEELKLK